MTLRDWLLPVEAPSAVFLVRLATGGVFLSEGLQKFLFPVALGAGRFARIGIPHAHFMAPFVGAVETVGGALVLLGLLTRLAALPLAIVMIFAILSTKLPFWLAHGFWPTAHEARADFAMLLCSLFLMAVGPGSFSLDALLGRRPSGQIAVRSHLG